MGNRQKRGGSLYYLVQKVAYVMYKANPKERVKIPPPLKIVGKLLIIKDICLSIIYLILLCFGKVSDEF